MEKAEQNILGVNAFNQYVLMNLPLVWRMVLMIVTYLSIALVPFCIAIFNKEKWSDYSFSKEKLGYQVLIGLAIALCMSFVFTVIFVYFIFAIALVEEFVFRGFFYTKMKKLCRVKIKNCTLLSVIIAHGVYDALITVWLNVFT